MREIKFRAWDKVLNKMITQENVDELLDKIKSEEWETEIPYSSDEWYPAYQILGIFDYFKDIQKLGIKRYEPSENRFEIMQYIGLKDKNGKEIYEGDIILTQPLRDRPFSQKAKSKRLRGIVEYNIKCGKNFIGNPDEMKYWGAEWNVEIIDKKDYEKYCNYGWGIFFECEVIGNIYENPELLEIQN